MSIFVLHAGALVLMLTCLASLAVYLALAFGRDRRTPPPPVKAPHRADDDSPVYGPW